MDIFQRLLSVIFPPYKYKLDREWNEKLLSTIVGQLPESYHFLVEQKKASKAMYLIKWTNISDFMFITESYPGESLNQFRDKSKNFKISGIKLFSQRTMVFEDAELLIKDGILSGIRISNSLYSNSEFDLEQIRIEKLSQEKYVFHPNTVDLMFQSLNEKDKQRIDELNFNDIQLGNRTYFSIYDMEDGNYIGIDKKQKVYSLIHDAVPMAKRLKTTLNEILNMIESGEFNVEEHLEMRYRRSR